MTTLYWQIGKRIQEEVIKSARAEYEKGFSEPNTLKIMQFCEQFQDEQIVSTLSRQLTWSHIVKLLFLKSSDQREFLSFIYCRTTLKYAKVALDLKTSQV
jgi:hypothetical protein